MEYLLQKGIHQSRAQAIKTVKRQDGANMLQVVNPRCEYRRNPLGIDTKTPRFFWQLDSDQKNVLQAAYQLQVSLLPSFNDCLLDTGRVEDGASIQIEYGGPDLLPRTRYHWRVRAWDTAGQETGYTAGDWFETGLMSSDHWSAEWMSPPEEADGQGGCPFVRGTCVLQGNIRSARAYVTAAGVYELHVNGNTVGEDVLAPGWTTYLKRHQYQTYDLTDCLQPGENTLGAIIAPGWYLGDMHWRKTQNHYGDALAFLMQAEITYDDGSVQVVCCDGRWKSTRKGPLLQSEIYHGETWDATREIAGWDLPGYDDSRWDEMIPLPLGYEQLVAQENLPVRRIEEIRPKEIIRTPSGQTVVDMGQNMVGCMRISVSGKAGEVVEIVHFEVLDQDGNVYLDNLRRARQTLQYTLKGTGTEIYEPKFTFMGFRYLYIRQYPGKVSLDSMRGIVLHTQLEESGTFECSDPLLNQLQHNIRWSQKGNFLDVPTDCPQRDERMGWLGDAQVFIRAACHNMNSALFFSKWLHDLAADQREDGALPHVSPNLLGWDAVFKNDGLDKETMVENNTSAAWADAVVICPWTLYQCYGDTQILRTMYPSMQKYLDYVYKAGDNPWLWNTGFHFGDWLGLDSRDGTYVGATDIHLIATAFYAWSAGLVSRIARLLGKDGDAARYSEWHQRIVENFQKEFVTPNGRLASNTQTACVLALMFDLADKKHRGRIVESLQKLLRSRDDHLATGFVGTPYLLHALSRNGLTGLAYKLLRQTDYPSWLYQVTRGATTIWEHWDGIRPDGSFWSADMNSFNHYAYGAVGDWMVQVVCGLDIDELAPGYKHFFLAPQPGGGLTHARISYDSLYGKITSGWEIDDTATRYQFSVPANTTATIHLDANAGDLLTVEGDAPLDMDTDSEGYVIEAGSGSYGFTVSRTA